MPNNPVGSTAVDKVHGDIAVYSCYFGKYEPLNHASMGDGEGYDRILFTDDATLDYPGAQVVALESADPPSIVSRSPKLYPELYFGAHKWIIYVDNRAVLKTDPREIVAQIEAKHQDTAPSGRYLFEHPDRRCVYRELKVVSRMKKIAPEEYELIRSKFVEEGLPKNAGLYMNTIMVQKMGDIETEAFNGFWWEQFQALCSRDQISLPYAMWVQGYKAQTLEIMARDVIDWPVYSFKERRSFQRQHS
jgi:hypothetical protein